MASPTYAGGVAVAEGGTSSAVDTTGWADCRAFITDQDAVNTSPPAISDSQGNTWVKEGTEGLISTIYITANLACFKPSGTFLKSATHTFSLSGTVVGSMTVIGVAGTVASVIAWTKTDTTAEPFTSPSVSPGQAALLVAAVASDVAGNPNVAEWSGSGFTERQAIQDNNSYWGHSSATKEVSAGTHSASATDGSGPSQTAAIGIVAFVGPADASLAPPPYLTQARRIAPLLGF